MSWERPAERPAFESWFSRVYGPEPLRDFHSGAYLNTDAGMAWDAWQARAATQAPPAPAVPAPMKYSTLDDVRGGKFYADSHVDGWNACRAAMLAAAQAKGVES